MSRRFVSFAVVCAVTALPLPMERIWGEAGHRIVARAAANALPAEMPAFFREAAPQLAYLNPEPDRWRTRDESRLDGALDGATSPDHYIDLEFIPAARRTGILSARDRYAFADSLRAVNAVPSGTGALPFAIVEVTQRMRVAFRQWRRAPNDTERRWIEARIINEAGILGHYVADGANPAHTTIHHNGWVGDNPKGYATDNRFHGRFESAYVQSRVRLDDVQPALTTGATVFPTLRPAVVAYMMRTHAEVERLYQLDKASPFDAQQQGAEHKAFAVARLAAGATMLRDLWWTAWITSASDSAQAPGGR